MLALLAAGLLAIAAQPAADSSSERQRERTLGEATVGGWDVWAHMAIDQSVSPPLIEEIDCQIERRGLKLTTGRFGGLGIELRNTDAYQSRNVRAIRLGDAVWEYRWRPYDVAEWQFADVRYPPPQPQPPCDGVHGTCTVVESAVALVRRSSAEPWLPLNTLGNEFLRAGAMGVGYPDPASHDPARMRWAEIALDRLPEALAWCEAAMRSDSSRRLRPR